MKKIIGQVALTAVVLAAGASCALAADMAAPPPPAYKAPAPIMVPVAYDWTGFYIGANIGYGWGTSDPGVVSFFQPVGTLQGTINGLPASTGGVIGGGQIGYNFQASNFVFGIEGDFSGADIKGSVTDTTNNYTAQSQTQWVATVRGRLGIAFDRVLVFGSGGFAAAGVKATLNDTYPSGVITTTSSNTYTGWAAGGGLEWAVAGNWTIRGEYLYLGLGNKLNSFSETSPPGWPLITTSTHITEQIARFAVNYKFGAPVTARY